MVSQQELDRAAAPGGNGAPVSGFGYTTRPADRRLVRLNLSDRLARQIQSQIQQGGYRRGDRLPSIREIGRTFGVGLPTVREALKKLETIGMVRIRPGSGVYVGRADHVLVMATPDYSGGISKKLLLDLIDARIPMETQSATMAAQHAAPENLQEMGRLLASARQNRQDPHMLSAISVAFHDQVGLASGNTVLWQLLQVLRGLFVGRQQLVPGIAEARRRDLEEHLHILQAITQRDDQLAGERMRAHLEGVREAVLRWKPPGPEQHARISARVQPPEYREGIAGQPDQRSHAERAKSISRAGRTTPTPLAASGSLG